jgi:hypothetical protein
LNRLAAICSAIAAVTCFSGAADAQRAQRSQALMRILRVQEPRHADGEAVEDRQPPLAPAAEPETTATTDPPLLRVRPRPPAEAPEPAVSPQRRIIDPDNPGGASYPAQNRD